MKQSSLFLFLCVFFSTLSSAQQIISIEVVDAYEKQPIAKASIDNDEFFVRYTTDEKGKFDIQQNDTTPRVFSVSAPGYAATQIRLKRGKKLYKILLERAKTKQSELVITASKRRYNTGGYQLNKKAILQKAISSNIIDALTTNPSVSQITTGSGISKPVIRGLGFNRVVVTKNGLRQEDQQWGNEHGIQIDQNEVESVEIINGPSTLLFGPDALGGVININTEKYLPENTIEGTISSQYQTNNGLTEINLSEQGKLASLFWRSSISALKAGNFKNKFDGRVFNSAYENLNFSGALGKKYSWGSTHLLTSGFNQKVGINEGDRDHQGRFTAVKDQKSLEDKDLSNYELYYPYQKLSHYNVQLKQEANLKGHKLQAKIAYQHNNRREVPEEEQIDQLMLQTYNYDLKYHLPSFKDWKIIFGLNGMLQYNQNGKESDEILIPDYQLFEMGGVAHAAKRFGNWHLEGALRYDRRTIHTEFMQNPSYKALEKEGLSMDFEETKRSFEGLSAAMGLSYTLNSKINLRVNWVKGFRSPNTLELLAHGKHSGTNSYEIGDPQLNTERNQQAELGALYQGKHAYFEMTTFFNHIQGFIYAQKSEIQKNDKNTFQFKQNNAFLYGGEMTLHIHPESLGWLEWKNTLGWVKGVFLHQKDPSMRYLPAIPAVKWRTDLELKLSFLPVAFLKKTFLNLGYTHYFEQNEVFRAYDTETPSLAYGLLHGGIGGDLVNKKGKTLFKWFLLGNNLLDVAYQDHLNRYKYIGYNERIKRQGIFNMGRNITFKLIIPLQWKS